MRRSVEPLCTTARWNRPFAAGVASSVEVFDPPPDWPKIITRDGSPPKPGDVVADPLERRHHVHHAAHAGGSELLRRADRGKMGIAEAGQTMVDRDDHDAAEQRELTAVVHRPVPGARRPPAAVERHQHGALLVVVDPGRPHVQRQAVLVHPAGADVLVPLNQLRVVRAEARRGLRRDGAIADAVARAGPRGRLARRHEAVLARRIGAVGNAAKDPDACVGHPADGSVTRLDIEEQRTVHAAAGRRGGRARGLRCRRLCLRRRQGAGADGDEAGEAGLDDPTPRLVDAARTILRGHVALQ